MLARVFKFPPRTLRFWDVRADWRAEFEAREVLMSVGNRVFRLFGSYFVSGGEGCFFFKGEVF